MLREAVKGRLPGFAQQPPLPPQLPESLGQPPALSGFSLTLGAGMTPRCWFFSSDGQWLLQVQTDRLVVNWRSQPTASAYPRYPVLREQFQEHAGVFWRFLAANGLTAPARLMGEITYVNTIESGAVWSTHGAVEKVFTVGLGPSGAAAPGLEDLRWSGRYVFPNRSGEPTGRLYTFVEPVVLAPARPAYAFNLVARGGESPTLEDVLDLHDAGRDVIVRMFTDLTTPQMHEEWGRYDDQ